MKGFSNAIHAYFVIRYQVDASAVSATIMKTVKFSSSKNKLKVYTGPEIECKLTKYKRTKMLGQLYTECMLRNAPDVLNEHYSSASKKDDLADAFLHCIYAIRV
jgi:glutaredoxin-related protein